MGWIKEIKNAKKYHETDTLMFYPTSCLVHVIILLIIFIKKIELIKISFCSPLNIYAVNIL